jgi:Uma2 family endonuclease
MATADLLERPPLSQDEIAAALSHPDALWEVDYGRVVEKLMSAYATEVGSRLLELIGAETRRRRLGRWITEMIFVLDSDQDLRRRPDVAFVSHEQCPLERSAPLKGDWRIAPNIAVEVISPGNDANSLARKRRQYFRYGVEEVWVIYPEDRFLEVYDPAGSRVFTHEQRLTSRLLPGIELDLTDLLPVVDAATET